MSNHNETSRGTILLTAVLLCLLALLSMLAACGKAPAPSEDGSSEEATTPKEEVTTMEPSKIYEPDATIFDSLSDLKANAALFEDRAPCTVSTLGYHKKDDGGAATYEVVKTKPNGIFEKLKTGIWAAMVTTDQVTPAQLGAVGDGKTDDSIALSRAALLAVERDITLVLTEGADYRINYQVTFGNIDIRSDNAKISYYGMDANTAAVYVESNTNISGTLNIWTIDNGIANSGERCALMFGRYGSESSVTNCNIETVVVTGGSKHTNAVFITGDSHDITIDRIEVPTGTIINRALLIHWGNASPYKIDYKALTHTAAADATPTQHPHDIHIGTIECHDLVTFDGWDDGISCAISLCGVYDIHVEEIVASNLMEVVHITSGDFGFQYADPDTKSMTCRGLRFDKITATGVSSSVVYAGGETIFKPITETWPEVHVGEIYAEGTGEVTRGISVHNTALIEVEKMTLKNVDGRALSIAYSTRKAVIGDVKLIDCKGNALYCDNKEGMTAVRNVSVSTLEISGSGAIEHAAIYINGEMNDLRIGSMTVRGCSYSSLLSLGGNERNVRIDTLTLADGAAPSSVVYARQAVTEAQNISLGNQPSGVILTAGESCVVAIGADYEPIDPPTDPATGPLKKEDSGTGDTLTWSDGVDA